MITQKKFNLAVAALCGLLALSVLLTLHFPVARGAQTNDATTISNQYRVYDLLASTTINGTSVIAQVGTSTTATSTNAMGYSDANGIVFDGSANIAGAKKVEVYFSRGAAYGGSMFGTSTYAIQVSPDNGTSWYYFNRLVVSTTSPTSQIANMFVASSDPTMNSSITIDNGVAGVFATTTLHYSMDLTYEGFQKMRCIARQVATGTPNGTNACMATVSF